MARTVIPVTTIDRAGEAPPAQTNSDQTHGMYIANNSGRVFVEIISTDSGSQTVGFAISKTVDGESVSDKTVTVPAGATRLAGPFPVDDYNQPASADLPDALYVNPSVNTTLKLRAYTLTSA